MSSETSRAEAGSQPEPQSSEVAPIGGLMPGRPRAGHVHIAAHSDTEAVARWLAEYRDSPRTLRAYRREAERLLLWLEAAAVA